MIRNLDHVGLVFKNASEQVALLSRLFGFEIREKREEPGARFQSTSISKGDVVLELIEPVGPQGMIQRFMEKRGEGMHHISIRVDDLDAEMKRLKALGVQFASEEPALVDETKVVFIHPRSTNGLLIELIQRPE